MYIPEFFLEEREEEILAFMREYNFAALVTSENDFPAAAHLPFIVEKRGEKIILSAHMAKANFQWKQLETVTALVIFCEPHAYVSPALYNDLKNVPTWNYIAVHAYGRAKLFQTAEENLRLLEKMIEAFDENYFRGQWREIPMDFKLSRAAAVTAFEIEVTDLHAKKKLNQNKAFEDAENVIRAFEKSGEANERQIARFMKELYEK